MKVILLANGTKKDVLEAVERLRTEIEHDVEIVGIDFSGKEDFSQIKADLAIVFGGDGSVLRAANQLGTNSIPVLAVHLGTLSFLSTLQADELIPFLKHPDVLKLPVVDHLLLHCELFRKHDAASVAATTCALNEVWLQGDNSGRLTSLELLIDGESVTTYRGDGLLIATPVGSTAHNLSAGGPILRKDIDAVVISPISPHTLSNRPLVESPERKFEIRVQQRAVLIVDGQEIAQALPGDTVRVTRAASVFRMLAVPDYSYYRMLRNKLGWNGSFIDEQ